MRLDRILATTAIFAALLSVSVAKADPVAIGAVDDSGKALMGDPVHGAQIFHRCMVCHSIQAGVNHIGPSLHGVVGRHSGIVPGFHYSAANKNSGIVWTAQNIFKYLQAPQKMVPGTKMTFPGLPAPQDRADVIAYLEQNSK
jgi:cytochrome c